RQLPGLVAVLAGGLCGSAARVGIGAWVPTPPAQFPTAIFLVNIIGSFLLGLYLARRERATSARWSLQFWAIGVLGSFTTFSAFSLDVVQLLVEGQETTALGYILSSTVGGLAVALLGQRVGEAVG
ncbi:MAG TPA: fluoride efflux transporter CrcB, partial [Acidimicrobiia bacterium]|nr:fluoride efflux transporter CrcB [Acidimicrobiia bacterium]